MSAIAAETMVGLGYSDIWNLSGGMAAWEQAGLKVDR
jgi:rhodanese-related sulfurtransferase